MTAAIRELERAGAEVHAASMDVGDEPAVRAFIESWSRERRPPIRGVIHAAGLLRLGLAASTTEDDLRVPASSETRRVVLHRGAGQDPPRLLYPLLIGRRGARITQARRYAAANAFLDALASARAGSGSSP